MKYIFLIGCGKDKRPHPCVARKMYTNHYFRHKLQYAELCDAEDIFILSGKYGVLDLDTRIEPYDIDVGQMTIHHRKDWAKNVVSSLAGRCDLDNDQFMILAGRPYYEFIVPYLQSYDIPLGKLEIGDQNHWLKKNIYRLKFGNDKDVFDF